jgi:hypothetical protein
LVLTAFGILMFVTACGGSTPSTPGSAAPTSAGRVDGKVAYTEYIACLTQHGIPMPSGTPSPPPADPSATRPTGPQFPGGGPTKPPSVADDAWAAAKAACAYIIPTP